MIHSTKLQATDSPVEMSLERQLQAIIHDNRPVLITGETGTGKMWIAQNIHSRSSNQKGEFVKVYCAGNSEEELRAELYGDLSLSNGNGKMDEQSALMRARNGTLFIKNFSVTNLNLITSLQRLYFNNAQIEERFSQTRLIVSITTRPGEMLTAGHPDQQHQHRWDILNMSPLRKRREHIPVLIQNYLNTLRLDAPRSFSLKALYRAICYSWPGNIRELHNAVKYAAMLCDSFQIETKNLPEYMLNPPGDPRDLEDEESWRSFRNIEGSLIHTTLQIASSKHRAADLLGLSLRDLNQFIDRYKLAYPAHNI